MAYAARCALVGLTSSRFFGTEGEDVGIDEVGLVVDDESSASAAVAPLVMMRAIVVAASVFFANCFISSPL